MCFLFLVLIWYERSLSEIKIKIQPRDSCLSVVCWFLYLNIYQKTQHISSANVKLNINDVNPELIQVVSEFQAGSSFGYIFRCTGFFQIRFDAVKVRNTFSRSSNRTINMTWAFSLPANILFTKYLFYLKTLYHRDIERLNRHNKDLWLFLLFLAFRRFIVQSVQEVMHFYAFLTILL